MRILLTGSAGFIGSAIRRALTARGDEVVAVDLMLDLAHRDPRPPADTHRLDVRNADQWGELLRGCDVVCHQAAVVGAGVRVGDLPLYASHNDLGTAALLSAMHDAAVSRLVLASSMVVYGEGAYGCAVHGPQSPGPRSAARIAAGMFDHACGECGAPLDWTTVSESAPIDPRSSYAASKVAQEHYAAAWAQQADSRAIALRYHNVYGPGMPRDTPYSGVAAIFRSSLERGESPQVFEDGGQMRDFVHVEDVARANLAAIDAATGTGRPFDTFNVCSGQPISIADVAATLAGASGRAPVITGQCRPGDVRHIVASPAKATADLGFTARIDPQQGITEFVSAPLRD